MARLPIDLMQSGVRENLPDVAFQTRGASAEAFGGGIGQEMQRFGNAGGELAAKIRAYEERDQKFEAQKGFIQAQDADSIAFEESQRKIAGNGAGFWQATRDQTRQRMDAFLSTLPESQRKEFAVDAERLVAARTRQAFVAQYQQADANTRVTLDEEARKAGLQVNQDPGAYEASVAQVEKLIDASPLTPIEKTQKKAALRNSLAFTAEQAAAQKDPASVVAAGVGGDLRAKIAGKESGGNNTAQNPNSTARGKYQFLDTTWNSFAGKAGVPVVTGENRGGPNDPRNDPALQERVMDQYIAASTAELTTARLPVTDANLYVLHFMGQKGGAAFLRAMNADASATAAALFPKEAAANTSIFYGGKDRTALSVSEVYAKLTKGLNTGGTSPTVVTASRGNLTADQTRAVDETARRALVQQTIAQTAADDAARAAAQNRLYIDLKEGPAPQAAYEAARKSGLLTDYNDITRAEKIIADRNKGDDDLTTGIALMQAGRSGANPFDKTHREGVDAYFKAMTKATGDPAAAAAAVFDRTGLVPPAFATALRGALVSDDPARLGAAVRTASNIVSQNPNALAGVEGREQIEAAASEYQRLTGALGMSEQDAAQRIMQDARTPKDRLKDETLQAFRKEYLTVEKLGSRLERQVGGLFGGLFGFGARMPEGAQRSAVANIYSGLAEEGMRQFQDPERALAYADFKIKQQFGTQNGIVTRYPPDKAGLPALDGKGHTWINEQAVDVVKDQLGIVVEPSQVAFVAITGRDGVNTATAFQNGGVDVTRKDSRPGQQSTFKSVPYQIVVMPKKGDPAGVPQVVHGAFFPDVDAYVNKVNSERTKPPDTLIDEFGMPYAAPAYAPKLTETPAQKARRQKAEADAALLASQDAERQRRIDQPKEVRRRSRELLSGGFGVPVDGQ